MTGAGLAPEAEAVIRDFVARHVRGVPLEIQVVPEIQLSRAGKLHRVVVEKTGRAAVS